MSAALEINNVNLVCKEVADVTGLNLDKLFTLHNVHVFSKVFSELVHNKLSGFLVLVRNFADVLAGSG
jgi:hypothetical protein